MFSLLYLVLYIRDELITMMITVNKIPMMHSQ